MSVAVVILIAYLFVGVLYVLRDLSARTIDRPAYARARGIGPKLMAAVTWGPVSIAMPWIIGWRWKGLKRYVFSLVFFLALAAAAVRSVG